MTNYKILNGNAIKFIAIIAMTIDHIAWTIYPGCPHKWVPFVMHVIGRITMPTMCFFVAEGFFHTRNVNKYTARMFLFAVISHIAYVYQWFGFSNWRRFVPLYYGYESQTSVIWTLAWGLVMLRIAYSDRIKSCAVKTILICLICLVSFPGDWSCVASLLVLCFGTYRGCLWKPALWMVFYVGIFGYTFLPYEPLYAALQLSVLLSIPILMLYNGQRGSNPKINAFMKWFFYIYYPLHLAILGVLKSYHLLPIYYY